MKLVHMTFLLDQRRTVRRKFAEAGATILLRGLMIASKPLPSFAEDNVLATATLPRDLSPWGMFINADVVV